MVEAVSQVPLRTWIFTAAYLGVGILGALAIRFILSKLHGRAGDAKWRSMLTSFVRTVAPWIFLVSFIWGSVLSLPLGTGYKYDAEHVLLAVVVIVISLGTAKVAGEAVHAGAVSQAGTSGSATIFVSITRVVVWTIGGLVLLDSLGIAITPILTALGVGGLAVALALQDTLSNLFAGIHILASRMIQPGDFVELDNGMQGYVVDTNWRNTIIRQLPNNLLVVPNATVASSTVTNYHLPEHEMSVTIPVCVSDASDLDRVEEVTIEVGRAVLRDIDGAVVDFEPTVRFIGIGNNVINFNVGLRATEVTKQALIIHEFIKRLHRRYREEGIEYQSPNDVAVHRGVADGEPVA